MQSHPRRLRRSTIVFSLALCLGSGAGLWAIVSNLPEVNIVHNAQAEHLDQDTLRNLVAGGQKQQAFTTAFENGDALFETVFNALDGVGANVGNGQRFTRVPRADLKGTTEWFNHRPNRVTGPNASACNSCHGKPFDDGTADASANVHRDTFRTGQISQFIERNTPHLFGLGAVQRLAEEMTDALAADRQHLIDLTCTYGGTQTVNLRAKGVGFGTLSATRTNVTPCAVKFNTDGVRGVDFQTSVDKPAAPTDLIIRPFQWKGSVPFIRDFNRGASHNELGMQAVEIAGDNVDGDGDGVVNELTIGDQTALAVYLAAQPRPTTLLELNDLGLIEPLSATRIANINRGGEVFGAIGCDSCHKPSLPLDKPIFSEPSQNAAYRDGTAFPAGQSPIVRGVDPRYAITFNLTKDQPDNVITRSDGSIFHLGSLRRDSSEGAIVELFSDLKRHEMGSRLAEPVNEIAGNDVTPIPLNPRNRNTPSTFMTRSLWGIGSTAPYMHDGRATTLAEAILEHATGASDDPSEAAAERRNYLNLPAADKKALIAFLNNLVLFKLQVVNGAEVAVTAPQGVTLRVPRGRKERPVTAESPE